jgi:ABC-type sugar transport system permease subunit
MKQNSLRTKYDPFFLILPFLVFFVVFYLFPLGFSLFVSFQKWNGTGKMEFVAFDNYKFIFTEDTFFYQSVVVTVVLLLLGTLSQHLFAIPLAILLNNKFVRGKTFFKVTFFLPYMISIIPMAKVFQYIFATKNGIVNQLMLILGLDKVAFLDRPDTLAIIISVIINWRFIGWNTVLYLSGLMAIPETLYEAADIDGASTFTKHLKITLPMLAPVLFFAITMSIINGIQIFEEPFIMAGGNLELSGGANSNARSLAIYIIYLIRRAGILGRGSAVAWVLFLVILVFSIINRKIVNRIENN